MDATASRPPDLRYSKLHFILESAAAIVAMVQQINLESVAEGVETIAQMEFLRKLRCNFIQGYYFSKPLAVEDATKLLQCGIA